MNQSQAFFLLGVFMGFGLGVLVRVLCCIARFQP